MAQDGMVHSKPNSTAEVELKAKKGVYIVTRKLYRFLYDFLESPLTVYI